MAHEHIIRNGLIVENSLAFLDNSAVVVTGITNAGPLVDRNHIVTEAAIKTTIESITLDSLSGVNFGSVSSDDILIYNGTEWVATASTSITVDAYTKVEADGRFLNLTGGTLTGGLTVPTITVNGNIIITGTVDGVDVATLKTDHDDLQTDFDNRSLSGNTDVTLGGIALATDQLLQYNGTQWINVNASSIVVDAYTKSEADTKFVYTTGDTMTGELIINVGTGNKALTTSGDVYITGDLYVSGITTTIDVENMSISDNLLLLNSGETGAGVSNDTAGFLVDRGTLSAVTLIFEESTFTIRAGETPSGIEDNTIDTSNTLKLAYISDVKNLGATTNYGIVYQDVLPNGIGILNNSATITYNSGNLNLNGGNITMTGTETVDGVDISVFKTAYDTFVGTTYANRTLGQINDVTITSVLDNQIIAWNSATTQWENIGLGDITGDFYTKSESDAKFVDVDGDIMTGHLTVPTLSSTTLINSGDISTLTLTLNSNQITAFLDDDTMAADSATAVASQQSIKAYVDNSLSNRSLSGNTDVTLGGIALATDQLLQYNGTQWINVDASSITVDAYTKTEADAKFVYASGDTMSGDLTITPLSGTGDRLVFVESDGTLKESDEYVFKTTNTGLGAGVSPTDTFLATASKGVIWHYVIGNGSKRRAGTITAVWDGSNIEYSEVSTNDIGGNINNTEFSFTVDIDGGDVRLLAGVGSGTWTVDTSRQMIG